MHVGVRKLNGKLVVFKPVYVAAASQMAVERCHKKVDYYLCNDNELQEVHMTELNADFHYEDGIVIVNTGINATIRDEKRNATTRKIVGPAICGYADTSTVIVNDQLVFTQSSAFHVRQESVDFSVDPYPLKLELTSNVIDEMKYELDAQRQNTTVLHTVHFTLTTIILIAVAAFIFLIKFRVDKHSQLVQEVASRDNPLQGILVVEDPSTGSGRARPVKTW